MIFILSLTGSTDTPSTPKIQPHYLSDTSLGPYLSEPRPQVHDYLLSFSTLVSAVPVVVVSFHTCFHSLRFKGFAAVLDEYAFIRCKSAVRHYANGASILH